MSTNSTSFRASEPVPEVETDVADPGAQSGSVSEILLADFSNGDLAFFPSQGVRARASRL